jgi:hypothetical protein
MTFDGVGTGTSGVVEVEAILGYCKCAELATRVCRQESGGQRELEVGWPVENEEKGIPFQR